MKAVIFSDQNKTFNLSNTLKVFNKPILNYQIEYLKQNSDIETIIIIGNYLNKEIKSNHIKYIFINSKNSFIDLKILKNYLNDEPFILLYGNILSKYNLSDLVLKHKTLKADITLLYSNNDNLQGNHYVKIDENTNQIIDLSFNNINYDKFCCNIFVIEPQLMAYLNDNSSNFFESFLPMIIEQNHNVHGILNDQYHITINSPDNYYLAQFELLNKEEYKIPGTKINTSYYGDKCDIEFSVELSGKQFFGNYCTVSNNCYLKDNIIADSVNIGKNCVIENSIILNETIIGDNCELKNCIIGENVSISSNVRISSKSIIARNSKINKYSGVLNV